jgi:hypothetical protein
MKNSRRERRTYLNGSGPNLNEPLKWQFTPHSTGNPTGKSAWKIPKEEFEAAIKEFERKELERKQRPNWN